MLVTIFHSTTCKPLSESVRIHTECLRGYSLPHQPWYLLGERQSEAHGLRGLTWSNQHLIRRCNGECLDHSRAVSADTEYIPNLNKYSIWNGLEWFPKNWFNKKVFEPERPIAPLVYVRPLREQKHPIIWQQRFSIRHHLWFSQLHNNEVHRPPNN